MKIRKFNVILVLIACLIVSIFGVINNYTIIKFTYTMVIVLCIFFLLGTFLQYLLNISIQKEEDKKKGKEINNKLIDEDEESKQDKVNKGIKENKEIN